MTDKTGIHENHFDLSELKSVLKSAIAAKIRVPFLFFFNGMIRHYLFFITYLHERLKKNLSFDFFN